MIFIKISQNFFLSPLIICVIYGMYGLAVSYICLRGVDKS